MGGSLAKERSHDDVWKPQSEKEPPVIPGDVRHGQATLLGQFSFSFRAMNFHVGSKSDWSDGIFARD